MARLGRRTPFRPLLSKLLPAVVVGGSVFWTYYRWLLDGIGMRRNTASQKLTVFAFTPADGLPKTGDAANLTAYVSIDNGALTALTDTSASEIDATNGKGYYRFDLTQAETNGDKLEFTCKSSTAGVVIIATPPVVTTLAAVDSSARVSADIQAVDADSANATVLSEALTTYGTQDAFSAFVVGFESITYSSLVRESRGALAWGTSDSGTTTTMVDAARTEADTDYWKGDLIVFTSGNLIGQRGVITAFTPGTDTITFSPATTQAVGTHTYEIWPAGDFLRPTTAGRTLDVSAGGEAGIDWANIGSTTSTNSLSNTTISSTQIAASIGSGGITSASFASGAITATAIATDAIGSAELATSAVDEIVDAVWDEARSGHVSAGTFGEYVLANVTLISGDSTAADNLEAILDGTGGVTVVVSAITTTTPFTVNVTQLSGDSTAADNAEAFFDGTGYAGTGNVIPTVTTLTNLPAITANWLTASGLATDAVAEIADGVWDEVTSGHTTVGTFGQQSYIVRANTAQAGAATTITLDASASAVDDVYNYDLIVITAGTGAGQSRYITDYVGSTKVATVGTWQTNPSSDSVFVILPGGQIPGASAPTAGEVADAVWDELRSGHVISGSFGEYVLADAVRVSNATSAADNLEIMAARYTGMIELDGALYRFTTASLANGPSGSATLSDADKRALLTNTPDSD